MSLTLGIPSRGVDSSLFRAINHAVSLEVDEILVGINPIELNSPSSPRGGELSDFGDPRIKFFFHSKDLGLYGNFRFLAFQASSSHFAWLCTDDAISPQIPRTIAALAEEPNLIIPNWKWIEYRPHENQPFDFSKSRNGSFPVFKTPIEITNSTLMCEPSWIFGVWRTEFLKQIFPRFNFDWLDTYLLQRAILSGKVLLIEVPTPTLIGTWDWAKKIPRSVSPRGHNPALAIVFQLLTLPRILKVRPKSFWGVMLRIKFLVTSSLQMNRELSRRRAY
jgi:hypothetical protein